MPRNEQCSEFKKCFDECGDGIDWACGQCTYEESAFPNLDNLQPAFFFKNGLGLQISKERLSELLEGLGLPLLVCVASGAKNPFRHIEEHRQSCLKLAATVLGRMVELDPCHRPSIIIFH